MTVDNLNKRQQIKTVLIIYWIIKFDLYLKHASFMCWLCLIAEFSFILTLIFARLSGQPS